MTDGGDGLSEGPTHYEILEVAIEASTEEIRAAYRSKAKTAHPDQGGDNATFRRLLEAYQTLTNPLRRREYDDRLDVLHPFARQQQAAAAAEPTYARGRATPEDDGWSGRDGAFTGDVEFPAWMRNITDEPWAQAERRATETAAASPSSRSTAVRRTCSGGGRSRPGAAAARRPDRRDRRRQRGRGPQRVQRPRGVAGRDAGAVSVPLTLATGDDTVVAWTATAGSTGSSSPARRDPLAGAARLAQPRRRRAGR